MPYRFSPIHPSTPNDVLIAAINKNFASLDNETITKIFNGANGANSLIQGRLPNSLGYGYLLYREDGTVAIAMYIDSTGTPILKVSKEGYDATTATNDQLIFNSAQNIFKVAYTTVHTFPAESITIAGGLQQLVYAHGLGSIPKVEVEIERKKNPSLVLLETGFPSTFYTSIDLTKVYSETDINLSDQYEIAVDNTDFRMNRVISNVSAGTLTCDSTTVRIYLLQETAN